MLTAGRPEALRVALLTSRRAPGLDRLLDRSRRPGASWSIVSAVVSDPSSESLSLLAAARVPAHVHDLRAFCGLRRARLGDRATRQEYDERTASLLAPHRPDLVVLCGWLWVLTGAVLAVYSDRLINVHDSDLAIPGADGRPLYRGLRSTRDAVANGESETRSTVHVVTEEVDVGPLLVRSWRFPVHPLVEAAREWNAEDILSAYAYAHREWMMRASWGRLLERAIHRYARGEVRVLGGRAVVAGSLGPEEIEWPEATQRGIDSENLAVIGGH
jgi:folate-dependent phosphoribosylglycinamide formyltransferase PurN